jgi:hypothetical protein
MNNDFFKILTFQIDDTLKINFFSQNILFIIEPTKVLQHAIINHSFYISKIVLLRKKAQMPC